MVPAAALSSSCLNNSYSKKTLPEHASAFFRSCCTGSTPIAIVEQHYNALNPIIDRIIALPAQTLLTAGKIHGDFAVFQAVESPRRRNSSETEIA
jgi:hypothetical protein